MQFSLAALSLLLVSTASGGPIPSANSAFNYINALFTKFDRTWSQQPSDCVPFKLPLTSQQFVRCSNIAADPTFAVTVAQMKQVWDLVRPAWQSKDTTINSRRNDMTVTLFDQIDENTPSWTIEHGKACRSSAKTSEKCLVVQFVKASDKKVALYHEPCGGSDTSECAEGLHCQFPGPFQGVRGRCVPLSEPMLGGDRNGEGGACGTRFEGCESPFYCVQGTCRAFAGPHGLCGAGGFAECVPGFKCKFSPDAADTVPAGQSGTCFAVKGKLNEECEVSTGCEAGLTCAESQWGRRYCVASK
jgi:hypothetical protein